MAIKISGNTIITDGQVLQNVSGFKTVNSQSILGSGDIAIASGGNYVMQVYTNTTPGGTTWTKPAGLVAVKVTVVGGGGGGNGVGPNANAIATGGGGGGASIEYIPAPSIPGPVTVTVGAGGAGQPAPRTVPAGTGGTSSFGSFNSATGGTGGGAGGAGSGGSFNLDGGDGAGGGTALDGSGGSSLLAPITNRISSTGANGKLYGAGGAGGQTGGSPSFARAGGNGAQGIVIVEEFY